MEDPSNDELPPPKPGTGPISPFKSSQILTARFLYAPLIFWLFHHPLAGVSRWVAAYLGIDLLTIDSEKVTAGLTAAYATFAAAFWEIKRRQAGKKTSRRPRAIAPSPVVETVKRLTEDIPLPKEKG